MEKAKVKTHPKYDGWVTITQTNHINQTIDDIHIKKVDIDTLIEDLIACRDEGVKSKRITTTTIQEL